MDCKTAKHVWNHKGGFLSGVACRFPGLLQELTSYAVAFKDGVTNPFDTAVKEKAGKGNYLVVHSDGESQMATWIHDVMGDRVANRIISETISKAVGVPSLSFANICCNGCSISYGDLTPVQELAIQMAAVNTNPDGSDIN
jgi:hypothetical protein